MLCMELPSYFVIYAAAESRPRRILLVASDYVKINNYLQTPAESRAVEILPQREIFLFVLKM
jgi:hypothetical protein